MITLLLASVLAANASSGQGPLSPELEARTFVFADPQLKVELVAQEPQIISPVAMASGG